MAVVKRIEAGKYIVSDGRLIIKDGKSWYILKKDGGLDFGPVTTLSSAKEYVQTGVCLVGQHNLGSSYGRRQSKKEFYANLASEGRQGNYAPAIIYFISILALTILFAYIDFKK